ncbi:ABC transporter ATP-binding protein [Stackebrandtia albiflava]
MVVHRGQIHGFLGPNGSGKTTTLRILLGLAAADHGRMRVFGRPVPQCLPELSDRIGAVVESPRFFGSFTARLTLSLLAGTIGLPDVRVEEVLTAVGLRDRADEPVKGYSLGMRQRLAVASALLKDPDLLILDEPTNGMDPAGIREMREMMRGLAADGMTLLVSSHLLSEVEQLCDTMTIVSRGRRVTHGRVADIVAAHTSDSVTVTLADAAEGARAAEVLRRAGLAISGRAERVEVSGAESPAAVTRLLSDKGIHLSGLTRQAADLETVFLRLTGTAPVDGRYPQIDHSLLPPAARSTPDERELTVTVSEGAES